jgi:2-polyprenyl-6-methoxyphenol hydroxylase-like FAD-dependent oxidoreductase
MDSRHDIGLLVCGAGPAGMTAALVASLEGLDVLLFETSAQPRRPRAMSTRAATCSSCRAACDRSHQLAPDIRSSQPGDERIASNL